MWIYLVVLPEVADKRKATVEILRVLGEGI